MIVTDRSLAAWLDLFYDLIVVAAVVVLSDTLAKELTWSSAGWVAMVFTLIWVAWVLTSISRLGSPIQDAVRRLLVLTQMFGLVLMALAAGEGVVSHAPLVGGIYAAVLVVVAATLQWGHTHGAPVASTTVDPRWACLIAAVAFWFVPVLPGVLTAGAWLAAIALLLTAAFGLIRAHRQVQEHADDARAHLRERFGALTIILLGETFVKLGITGVEGTLEQIEVVVLTTTFVIVFALWWAYFDGLERHGLPDGSRGDWWMAVHLPLHLGLIAVAVAVSSVLIVAPTDQRPEVLLVTAPVALSCLALATLDVAGRGRAARRSALALVATAAVITMVGVAGSMAGAGALEPTIVALGVVTLGGASLAVRVGAGAPARAPAG